MIKGPPICKDCLITLTDQEEKYFFSRCEKCESDHHRQIQHWRADEQSDKFSMKITIH